MPRDYDRMSWLELLEGLARASGVGSSDAIIPTWGEESPALVNARAAAYERAYETGRSHVVYETETAYHVCPQGCAPTGVSILMVVDQDGHIVGK